jgi:hypothetical protein
MQFPVEYSNEHRIAQRLIHRYHQRKDTNHPLAE